MAEVDTSAILFHPVCSKVLIATTFFFLIALVYVCSIIIFFFSWHTPQEMLP